MNTQGTAYLNNLPKSPETLNNWVQQTLNTFSAQLKLDENNINTTKQTLGDPKNPLRTELIKYLQKLGQSNGLTMTVDGKWGSWIKTFLEYHKDKALLKQHHKLISTLLEANKKYNKTNHPLDEENALLYLKLNHKDQIDNALIPTLSFADHLKTLSQLSPQDQTKEIQFRGKVATDGKRWVNTKIAANKLLNRLKILEGKKSVLPITAYLKIQQAIPTLTQIIQQQEIRQAQKDQYNGAEHFQKDPNALFKYLSKQLKQTESNPKLLLKNLQKLWAEYFGIQITASGDWGIYTRAIIEELADDQNFKPYLPLFNKLLKQYSQSHNAQTLSEILLTRQKLQKSRTQKLRTLQTQQLQIKEKSQIFAYQNNFLPKSPIDQHKSPSNNLTTKLNEQSTQNESTSLQSTFSQLPPKSVETSIPQDNYHQALLTFLKTKFTDSEELDLRTLATQIANENGNGSLYEKYSKLRNNSPEKQQLLEQQRNALQKEVKKQAGEIAITTIKSSLKQMGVPIDEGNFVPDARWGYIQFQDTSNPHINYFYRPSSGFISTRNYNAINSELKSVDTSGYHYHILSKIPSYQELIDQASDPLWLPNKRLNTQEEMKEHILHTLKSQITYSVGNIEQESMQQRISLNTLETNIIHQTKKLLHLQKDNCSEQEQKTAYQILRQLGNSCKTMNLDELKKLNTFIQLLATGLEQSKNSTKSDQGAEKWPQLPNPKTPLELIYLLTDQESIKELRDQGENKAMQHFGIGKLFARLSKPTPGKDEHHTIFDSKKLDRLLDLKNSPDLLKDPEYWKSYAELLKNTIEPYRKRAETQEQNIAQQQAQQAYTTIQRMPQQERGYT